MDPLALLGNIPFSTSAIADVYPSLNSINDKASNLENSGKIIRLKRNLYVLSPSVSGKLLSLELIANHLYGPSYVSMESALRYYGLIPEAVQNVTSITIKRGKDFQTPIALFRYTHCAKEYFNIGIRTEINENYSFLIACPEKALCDLIVTTSGINYRFQKDILNYLGNDLRLDMDEFSKMDSNIFTECAKVGKKSQMLLTIAKILKNERHI